MDVIFAVVAAAYPLGFAFVLYAYNKPYLCGAAWVGVAMLCVTATAFALAASLDDPWIMLKIWTRAQVTEQLANRWLLFTTVLHFALGDLAVLFLVLHVSRHRIGMPWWQVLLYVPLMLWCNVVGLLAWLLTPSVVLWAVRKNAH